MKRSGIYGLTTAGFAAVVFMALATTARAEPTRTCEFDPDLGLPNPLGMRAYITVTEEDGNTTFLFEQFSSNVGDGSVPVTLETNRMMTFYETDIDQARQLMLNNSDYYSELVGYPDSEGFGPVNEVLTCTP
jgi:hypothetical protein